MVLEVEFSGADDRDSGEMGWKKGLPWKVARPSISLLMTL